MPSFFKKALSIFVETDPDPQDAAMTGAGNNPPNIPRSTASSKPEPAHSINQADLAKFEKHFEQLFEQTNLPGPDYYEFWKMMDTLESHIANEGERMQAVFASLKIQGLSKQTLLETAGKYRAVIEQDRANFESVVQKKSESEIASRKKQIQDMEKEREEKRKLIEKLQKEVDATAGHITGLQDEITKEEGKIVNAQKGYLSACTAMIAKIDNDIQRFQQTIS